MKYYYTLNKIDQVIKLKISNVEDVELPEPSHVVGRSIKWYNHFKKFLAVSHKIEHIYIFQNDLSSQNL
jgi:hypothetical protein